MKSYSGRGTDLYYMPPKGKGFGDVWPGLPTDKLSKEFQNDLSEEDLKLWNIVFQPIRSTQTHKTWEKLGNTIGCYLYEERERFLSLCDFSTKRRNEIEDVLYLKPAFICRTHLKNNEDILDILLADQDVIFTSNDEFYRTLTINDENEKAWNEIYYDSKTRRELIRDHLSAWDKQSVSVSDQQVCKALIDRIAALAAKKHLSIYSYLETQYRNRAIPTDDCVAWLQQLVPECAEKITPIICVLLFQDVLPEYIKKDNLYRERWYRPTHLSGYKYQIPAQLFINYKARLRRLKRLKDGFKKEINPILQMERCRFFSIDSENHVPNNEITDWIREFFVQIGSPLNEDNKKRLEERIAWAMEQSWVPDGLRPVFLTYMTICCGRGITGGKEYPIPERFPVYDSRMGKPHQRYAQLILLNRLCDTLAIGQEDRLKNWEQYLYWQGKTILSADETQFWRDRLGEDYESLPAIGFQLCCAEYMQDCVPPHLEDLLYDGGSALWKNGYHKFWTANQQIIKKRSVQLAQTHPKIVTEYRRQRKQAKRYFHTGKDWLNKVLTDQISIDLNEFNVDPKFNEDELKRLILETELQLAVCSEARSILVKSCKKVYQLDPSLFQELT